MSRTLAGLFILTFSISTAARAECPTLTPSVDALAPADGATGLPTNAAVAFGVTPRFAGYAPSVSLTTVPGGAPVTGALYAGPAESFLFLPDAPLAVDQTYQVQVVDSSGTGTPITTVFTTGTGADLTNPAAPAPPTLEIVGYTDPVREDDCLLPGYWVVEADWEDVTGETSVLYVLDVQFEDLIPQEMTAGEWSQALVSAESRRTFNAPEDTEVRVRVHVIDGAGRQENSPDGVITTPPAPGAGGAAGCACELRDTGDPLRTRNVAGTLLAGVLLGLALGALRLRGHRG